MGLIAIALQIFGTAADGIAVGQFVTAYFRQHGASVRELFRQCFIRAVNRKRAHLAHFVLGKDAGSVAVDRANLDRAIAQLDGDLDLRQPRTYEGVLIADLGRILKQ